MKEIKITIVNWEKYNPQEFKSKYPHWFRLNKDTLCSQSLFNLDPEERWVWIGLLCIACEKKSASVTGLSRWFSHRIGVSEQVFENAVQKLVTSSSLRVNSEFVSSKCPPTEQDSTIQNRTRHKDLPSNWKNSSSPVTASVALWPFEKLSTQAKEKLAVLYPESTFLEREFAKMQIWIQANKHKTPRSKSGWTRFVMGWLERGWERHRKVSQSKRVDGVSQWAMEQESLGNV